MLIALNESTLYNTETGGLIAYDLEGNGKAVLLLDGTVNGEPISLHNGAAAEAWGKLQETAERQERMYHAADPGTAKCADCGSVEDVTHEFKGKLYCRVCYFKE